MGVRRREGDKLSVGGGDGQLAPQAIKPDPSGQEGREHECLHYEREGKEDQHRRHGSERGCTPLNKLPVDRHLTREEREQHQEQEDKREKKPTTRKRSRQGRG